MLPSILIRATFLTTATVLLMLPQMANEGLVVVVSYDGIRGGWGQSSRIEASTEEEEIRGVDAGILGRQTIVVIGCQLSVVSGRQVGRLSGLGGKRARPPTHQ